MIDVLVRKLPAKVAEDWEEKKLDDMASEDIFAELMKFLKAKKEVTKKLLHKQKDLPRHSGGRSFEPICEACRGSKNPQDTKH